MTKDTGRVFTFPADLPDNAQSPVKPLKEFDADTGRVKYRIWLDAWLVPGEGDAILAAGSENNFSASLTVVEPQSYGKKAAE